MLNYNEVLQTKRNMGRFFRAPGVIRSTIPGTKIEWEEVTREEYPVVARMRIVPCSEESKEK